MISDWKKGDFQSRVGGESTEERDSKDFFPQDENRGKSRIKITKRLTVRVEKEI